MSHMPNAYAQNDVQLYQEPERTSVMAILSLVFGIVGCCGGITSLLGVLFAIIGLVGISRSRGRVGGKAMAIAGLVISILTLALWIGLYVGMSFGFKKFSEMGEQAESALLDIQNAKYESARTVLSPPASEVLDEDFAAFVAAYQPTLGNFVSMPQNVGDWINGYQSIGDEIKPYSGRQGYIPMPMRFDTGWVLMLYVIDPQGRGTQPGQMPRAEKILLIGSDGKEYTLPPNAGDADSENQPTLGSGAQSTPDSSEADEAPGGENADTSGTEEPEGP